MGAVAQVNDNRHGKAALAQTSFGGFVPKGGSPNDSGVLEIIVPDAQASVRWAKHGYPSSLAKWHHHPHIEIHLIREGTGLMMAGNAVVPYEAGQVALIGSNLPHNWVSDIAPGERLRQRDVVCHVRPETMRLLMSGFPETSGFAMVLKRAGQALVLSGESARQAGSILESMEEHSLACRVSDLIRVLDVFAHAPADESYTVVASGYDPAVCSGAERVVNDAIEYISSGCEMVMSEHREKEWREVIAAIRECYDGTVSYNTDKYQEDRVKWWDCVDVISSSGYYPIQDWEQELDRIEAVVKAYHKPFFFAEAGCMSRTGSKHVPNNWGIEGKLRLEEQIGRAHV